MCCNRNNVTGALVMIIIGAVFLLNNFGLLPWGLWGMVWKLWPLFLIVPGIMMLVRRN